MTGEDEFSQRAKSFIHKIGQGTVSFTDAEFAMLKRFVERRGRDAAHVTVAPVDTAQYCYTRSPSPEISLGVVVVVDSHIQRIVLATEETTVTQQVSHRPIKRQSRLWSQRGTKVNGSHHGDNPLLRPTGIQIATKSYAALQAMAPTNIKTVHQTSLLHSRATSIDSECCRLPTTSVLSKKPEKLRSNQF